VIDALYAAISYPPGGEPDWTALRALFLPGARVVMPRVPGIEGVCIRSVAEWIADYRQAVLQSSARGFREVQLAPQVTVFRDLAHVLSSYASYSGSGDTPSARGLNSVQMVRSGGDWYIVSVVWDVEGDDYPLPDGFATKQH
jgi:hypothetical protein